MNQTIKEIIEPQTDVTGNWIKVKGETFENTFSEEHDTDIYEFFTEHPIKNIVGDAFEIELTSDDIPKLFYLCIGIAKSKSYGKMGKANVIWHKDLFKFAIEGEVFTIEVYFNDEQYTVE